MATAAATIIETPEGETIWDVGGQVKTTQAGKLVIQVAYVTAAATVAGEVVATDETRTRWFRVTGKGQPFPINADAATIAALKARGFSKRDIARELQAVYLYVTEITPSPAPVAAPVTPVAEVCTACGYSTASYPCVMSADGEGDHQPVAVQSISADDAAFIARYDVHAEQGAAER